MGFSPSGRGSSLGKSELLQTLAPCLLEFHLLNLHVS